MNRYDLSEFVLSLMDKANTHTPLHFQKFMMGLMREITTFDAAWWGWSLFRGGRIVMVHTMISDLPPDFEPKVKSHLSNDPFVRTGRNLERYARSITVSEVVTDPGFRAFAEEFNLTQMLNGHCKVRDGRFNFFMSLYRHGDKPPFTETENADFLAILRHIEQALSMCLQLDLAMRVDPNTDWALIDHTGELFLSSTGFQAHLSNGMTPGQRLETLLKEVSAAPMYQSPAGTGFERNRYSVDLWLITVSPPNPLAGLSAREQLVTNLLVKGLSMRQAATTLGVSVNTVRNQVASIYRKTGVTSRTQLVQIAKS
ncbi:MAG: helix-turn-helix transcriptional regulator [Sulfitobacter sp.]